MSNENRREATDFGVAGGSHAREDIQDKANVELLNEAINIVATQSAEEMDVNAIMERLALLQERAPVPMNCSPSGMMADLREKHPLVFESLDADEASVPAVPASTAVQGNSKPRSKKRRRPIHYAAGIFAACFCLMVTANALGVNPVQAFLKWADGIIQIYSNPSGIMELPADDPCQYHSLGEALEAYDMAPEQIPCWIPDDYRLSSVDVLDTGTLIQCSANYIAERGEMLIRATRFKDNNWNGISERNDDGEEYEKNGLAYYLVTNQNLSKAGWNYEGVFYAISGQITKEELQDMIDSIAEGVK